MRQRLRGLIIGLMVGGLTWIYLVNFLRLGLRPGDYPPALTLVNVGGALAVGLLLDRLAGHYLRPFFRALRHLATGRPLDPRRAEVAVGRAIRFPERSALFLVGLSVFLITLHRAVQYRGHLLATLLNAADRTHLFSSVVRDLLLSLLLGLLLFTLSRRILRPGVAAFGLRTLPNERHFPVGLRLAIVVLATGVFAMSLFISTAEVIPTHRRVWIYLPPVLLTALVSYLVATDIGRDLEAIADRLRVLAQGGRPDLHHRFAITDKDEVGELVAAINALQDRVEQEMMRMERDLEAARSIQMEMLPRSLALPNGWRLTALLHPAHEVGGDFYDLIDLGEGRYGLVIGDAAGKGLPAALLMASTVSLIRSQAPLHRGPTSLLEAVNRLLCASLPPLSFVTTLYAVIDTTRNEAVLATAGHLPPILGDRELTLTPALPLGVELDLKLTEQVVTLRPGEPFLLYTDGLVEAEGGPTGFDMTWLAGRLQARRPALAALMEPLADPTLAPPDGASDDVTLLLLIPPAAACQLEFPSRLGEELTAAELAARFAREHGPGERAEEVATAVGEACLNAIIHGNGIGSKRPVHLHLAAGPTWLEAVVRDYGSPFALPTDPPNLQAQMAGDGPIRGWGVHLMRTMADEIRVEPWDEGKQVRIQFGGGHPAADSGGVTG